MLKKILISLVFVVLVLGVGILLYLDSIVESGIEVVGSRVLGTGVTVTTVNLSPLNGAGSISGLSVENPGDFSADYIFELQDVSVDIDVASVMSDTVLIESVVLTEPTITYETRLVDSNLGALLDNLTTSGDSGAGGEGSSGGGKQLIIRELLIEGPQLNLSAANLTAPIPLPDIRLENIGEPGDSASPAEVLGEVLAAVNRSILQADLPDLEAIADEVEERLTDGVEQLQESVGDTVESLGNSLRNVINPN